MSACAFCGGETEEIIDFGNVALAGAFLKPEQFVSERRYSLRLHRCPYCFAVQLADRVDADTLFRNYFYFSSSIASVRQHAKRYAQTMMERFAPTTVIEIGCNDGVLLRELAEHGINAIGVDPATNVVDTIPSMKVVNEFFDVDTAAKLVNEHGRVDMVIANNVFAHIPDIRGATQAVCDCLADDGVFVMEAHHLGAMLRDTQYDWIYHEHIYYHSLIALETHFSKFGLRVFDVEPVALHAGSMRYYVCKDKRPESPRVGRLYGAEIEQGLHMRRTYVEFAQRVQEHRASLQWLLSDLEGKQIVGYGASGRANALIQYCDIKVHYMIDDAPAKEGFFTPGSHFEIYTRAALDTARPDYILVFAWSFLEEIAPKCAGIPMVVPFPSPRIVKRHKQEEMAA